MSKYTFHRLLQHIGSNGPRSNAEVDHEIYVLEQALDRIDCESGSSDAMPAYDRY